MSHRSSCVRQRFVVLPAALLPLPIALSAHVMQGPTTIGHNHHHDVFKSFSQREIA
jgi:hypothetical protein